MVAIEIVLPSAEKVGVAISTAEDPFVKDTLLFDASKFVVTVIAFTPVCEADTIAFTTSSGFSTALTTTLGVYIFFLWEMCKNRLYVRTIYAINKSTKGIIKRIAVGSQPMMNSLELPVL